MLQSGGSQGEKRSQAYSRMATYAETLSNGETNNARAAGTWLRSLIWFGALLLLCYAPVLYHLAGQWYENEDMGHGFFVPVIAGYIAWQRRDVLLALNAKPNYWGILFVLWGAVQMLVGTLGAELFLARTAFLISLVGV